MAKLCSTYSLCPIIEQKNFLGVSDDSVVGCVIVTLGKNIVIRYKLSDQKQVNSWSSRHKLSAPVVFDSLNNQYIGVVGSDQIAVWKDNFTNLSKEKKFKFIVLIHSVLTAPGVEPLVVYQNGIVSPLSIELQSRKEPHFDYFIPTDHFIKDAKIAKLYGTYYVYLFVKAKGFYVLHFIPVGSEVAVKSSISLFRDDTVSLTSYTVMEGEVAKLITFWSDGKVYCLDLHHLESSPSMLDVPQAFPGEFISSLSEISSTQPAVMVQISPVHVAVYGADPSSEGAVLGIYNTKFGVVQNKSHFKMYTNPPRLWKCGTYSSLILITGQYLSVAPYVLDTPRLSTLIGSKQPLSDSNSIHKEDSTDTNCEGQRKVPKVSWTKSLLEAFDTPPLTPSNTRSISCKIEEMASGGLPHVTICNSLMPQLMETKDSEGILELLDNLSDIPENWLFLAISLCLAQHQTDFALTKGTSSFQDVNAMSNKMEEGEEVEFLAKDFKLCEEEGSMRISLYPRDIEPSLETKSSNELLLLNSILLWHPPLGDASSLILARTKLNLKSALFLLKWICHLLNDGNYDLINGNISKQGNWRKTLLCWCSLIVDSHYQQFLLSKDKEVIDTLKLVNRAVVKHMDYLRSLQILETYIHQLKNGKCFTVKPPASDRSYVTERIRLY